MKIIVTGAAGFVGAHLCAELIKNGHEIIGIDNFNSYYSRNLKQDRIAALFGEDVGLVEECNIQDYSSMEKIFDKFRPEVVINLAAQAGVRLPETQFNKYYESNIDGFIVVSNLVRKFDVPTFLYASSSSVYGNSKNLPFSENDLSIRPISVYGNTKLFNELHANVFLQDNTTKAVGMRFFTVYGPWGRPDMAYFRILESLMNGSSFTKYGDGRLKRDFTYISDTVESIVRLIAKSKNDPSRSNEIFNIGGGNPVSLNELIAGLELTTQSKIKIIQSPASIADVEITFADYQKLEKYIDFKPQVNVIKGTENLHEWVANLEKSKLSKWVNE